MFKDRILNKIVIEKTLEVSIMSIPGPLEKCLEQDKLLSDELGSFPFVTDINFVTI